MAELLLSNPRTVRLGTIRVIGEKFDERPDVPGLLRLLERVKKRSTGPVGMVLDLYRPNSG